MKEGLTQKCQNANTLTLIPDRGEGENQGNAHRDKSINDARNYEKGNEKWSLGESTGSRPRGKGGSLCLCQRGPVNTQCNL